MFDLEDAKKRGCLFGGKPARILAGDLLGSTPIAAAVNFMGSEFIYCFGADGKNDTGDSLVNLPREVTVWAGRSDGGHAWYMDNEDDARAMKESHQAQGRAAGYAPVTIKLTR